MNDSPPNLCAFGRLNIFFMFIVDTTRINSIGNISGYRPLLPRSAPHKIYNIDRTIDILFQMNTHKNISELKTAGVTSLRRAWWGGERPRNKFIIGQFNVLARWKLDILLYLMFYGGLFVSSFRHWRSVGGEMSTKDGRSGEGERTENHHQINSFGIVPCHSQWSFIAFQQMVYFLSLLYICQQTPYAVLICRRTFTEWKTNSFFSGFPMNLSLISFSIEERNKKKQHRQKVQKRAKKYIKHAQVGSHINHNTWIGNDKTNAVCFLIIGLR